MTIRRRGAAAALLAFVLPVTMVGTAQAKDLRPSPSATKSVEATDPSMTADGNSKAGNKLTDSMLKDALETWTATAKAYKLSLASHEAAVAQINEAFTGAVRQAKADFAAARARATTAAMKSAAAARFNDAVTTATESRQAALDALPALPPAPGPKPTKKSLLTGRAVPIPSPTS